MSGLVFSRVVGYLAFGTVGGWAADRVKRGLDKLALYDEIDDETGLGNARSLLAAVDLEKSRADRYQKLFAVVVARFSDAPWTGQRPRKRRHSLRQFGSLLGASVRASDHLAHGRAGEEHLVAAVLPETSGEGAAIFTSNLAEAISRAIGAPPETTTVVYPGDEEELARLLDRFKKMDAASRPGA